MPTTLNFKSNLDLPMWRMNAPAIAVDGAGQGLAWDMRNDVARIPGIYSLRSAAAFDVYSPSTDDWMPLASPTLTNVIAAGATLILHPTQGPRGNLAAGGTTTTVVLSTALPAAVGVNMLSSDGGGSRIRIISKASGRINERNMVANTAGTTPTITLDVPLDFTPALNDTYEMLTGKVYLLDAGLLAAGSFRSYDLATDSYASLSNTNLPATITTDSSLLALSELYVSSDRVPGSGFVNGGSSYDPNGTGLNGVLATAKNAILATAATATTITGSGMPADLQANEYANFQVRIVEDTTTFAAVGQRSPIVSHTAGATGVFTVAAWGTTPSATAKFVIENRDDLILLRSSTSASVFSYSISGNAWLATTFAAGNGVGVGVMFEQCFGIVRDPTHNRRHSHIFCFRGGTTATLDILDIANGVSGTWTSAVAYYGQSQAFAAGSCAAYDPITLGGKFLHICVNGTQRMLRFNMLTQNMEPGTYVRYPPSAAVAGPKLAFTYLLDGVTKLAILMQKIQSLTIMMSNVIQG